MRDVYHDKLDRIGKTVFEMTNLVAVAIDHATSALLDANLAKAEAVMEADKRVDLLCDSLGDRAFLIRSWWLLICAC